MSTPQARIDARLGELRSKLAGDVVAIASFEGFWGVDGTAFALAAGQCLRRDHPVVAAYSDRFRALTPVEVERAVKSERAHLELAAGL